MTIAPVGGVRSTAPGFLLSCCFAGVAQLAAREHRAMQSRHLADTGCASRNGGKRGHPQPSDISPLSLQPMGSHALPEMYWRHGHPSAGRHLRYCSAWCPRYECPPGLAGEDSISTPFDGLRSNYPFPDTFPFLGTGPRRTNSSMVMP